MSVTDSEENILSFDSNLSRLTCEENIEFSEIGNPKSKRFKKGNNDHTDHDFSDDEEPIVNIENFSGPFLYWIDNKPVQDEIRRIFRWFLKNFTEPPARRTPFYIDRIRQMCRKNGASLEVDYNHVGKHVQNIAIWLADYPARILELLDAAAMEVVEEAFPGYRRIQQEVHVRICGLPIEDKLRELRQIHLGRLVRCFGVVTKRTSVFPQLKTVRFNCVKCRYLTLPVAHASYDKEVRQPDKCRECGSRGPFRVNQEKTLYRNFQRITLQESPGSVPAGRVPRNKEVILTNDLIDSVRPGEEICMTGIYKNQFEMALNSRNGFPVFATVIEANHVQKLKHQFETNLTDEEKKQIRNYSKMSNISEIIINSVAPSIHGHRIIKEALALALFGGTLKEVDKGRHHLRGDINVLILGDPGTAKSQFLKYIEKAAPRAVYSTGKGASAVGLTASVHKDPKTREWVLEGGALVLADQGICLIDEFDKMNEYDRTSIHEAMEQQTISISKAGIVATLQARCSVVAVANPLKERYDSSATFLENIDLADTIISRFDIICVVKDTVDPIEDEKLARFVINSHVSSHPMKKNIDENSISQSYILEKQTEKFFNNKEEKIPQELLKKYISFAKNTVKPKINNIDQHKVTSVYSELRKESMREGAIPIGIRHIESIIRMAEARAKMHLRDYVSNEDIDVAISITVNSFIDTQKFSVMRSMRNKFKRFLHTAADYNELLFHVLAELFRDEQQFRSLSLMSANELGELEVDAADFEAKAKQLEIFNLAEFFRSRTFLETFEMDASRRKIRKVHA